VAKKLRIKRYVQYPAECAAAAAAAIANYYNKNIDYEVVRLVAEDMLDTEINDGLYDGEIGMLLNLLGFRSVSVMSTDLDYFDYSWCKLSKINLINRLKHVSRVNSGYRENCKSMIKFLTLDGYRNKLIIDYIFGEYIRKNLDLGLPVMLSYNWTMFLRSPKTNDSGVNDDGKGEIEMHAVVACGYNNEGVYVVDSHDAFYKYKLKKYREGRYLLKWEDLMVIMGCAGNVIVPTGYEEKLLKYEF